MAGRCTERQRPNCLSRIYAGEEGTQPRREAGAFQRREQRERKPSYGEVLTGHPNSEAKRRMGVSSEGRQKAPYAARPQGREGLIQSAAEKPNAASQVLSLQGLVPQRLSREKFGLTFDDFLD